MIVGTEWLIEAAGCDAGKLRDEAALRLIFDRVIDDLDLKAIDSVWHTFSGEGGVTGLVALTESHLACHTYPEHRTATFNLYCCRTRPEWDWEKNLKLFLGAEKTSVARIERGNSELKRKLVNYGEVKIRNRGRLPHWEKEEGIYFVTFRLADSVPADVLGKLEFEREQAEAVLSNLDRELSFAEKQKLDWLFSERVDDYLDRNYGECHMRNTRIAKLVADSIKYFDGERYHLFAWCVMPNHVHAVFKIRQRNQLEEVLHSWKSFTASEANKVLGRAGEFWQREYYDHLVRDEEELVRIVKYVIDNPAKAGILNWQWVDGPRNHKAAAEA